MIASDVRIVCTFQPMPKKPQDLLKTEQNPSPPKRTKKRADDATVASAETVYQERYWAEVYCPSIENWICVDPTANVVESMRDITKATALPHLVYVLSVDRDGAVNDLTLKYSTLPIPELKKHRADQTWWTETLGCWPSVNPERDRREEGDLLRILQAAPFPTAASDYKSHPLYVLKRHLRKFEALHPPDVEPVGYFKAAPIYPRSAVQELHTADAWLKLGMSVREGQLPYKFVKPRPKPGAPGSVGRQGSTLADYPLSGSARIDAMADRESMDEAERPIDATLPVYGAWQTQKYQAPPAQDGKVPKNAYGNVYLFQPWMLPPGTVQLQMPGIDATARRLGIDGAPAVVGWKFTGRSSYPEFEGFVVCEEHAEALLDAWNVEQSKIDAEEAQKRSKQALYNWRRLTKALLLREQIRRNFAQTHTVHQPITAVQQDAASFTESLDEKPAGSEDGQLGHSATCGRENNLQIPGKMSWPRNKGHFDMNLQ